MLADWSSFGYDDEGTLLRKLNDHQVYEALQEGRITDVEK